MKQELAFKAAAPRTDGFGLRIEAQLPREWFSPATVGFSNATMTFLQPLVFQKVDWKWPAGAALWLFEKAEQKRAPTRAQTVAAPDANAIEAKLFDARANAKMVAAQVSMHLSPSWRSKIYRQVDELLEAAEWEETDGVLDAASMKTFLRFVIYAEITSVPSLGMAPTGHILAAWHADSRRLTIEFQPNDRCRVAISHTSGDDTSIITFVGSTVPARSFLERMEFPLG